MSEMQSARGIIKEIYMTLPDIKAKVKALSEDKNIPLDKLIYGDEYDYIEHDDYAILDNRLFDISAAKPNYDDNDRVVINPLGEGNYYVDLRYYNGGTCFEEIVEEYLAAECK